MKHIYLLSACLLGMSGCLSARDHVQDLHSTQERELTAGVVQREIRRGMSQGDVASALGSPNIVSRDDSGLETWIYDKVATEASYSNAQSGVGGMAGAVADVGSTLLLGLASGSYNTQVGASAVTQKTLTVVVKYDNRSQVESATFHSSRF